MTAEQLEKLNIIGRQIQKICPDMYGSIRFNLKPARRNTNINVEQSFVLEYKEGNLNK
jgi:hypothetical protein